MAKKVGAPFGNKNAAKNGKAMGNGGARNRGIRAALGAKVNYSSPGFLKAAAAQKRRGY